MKFLPRFCKAAKQVALPNHAADIDGVGQGVANAVRPLSNCSTPHRHRATSHTYASPLARPHRPAMHHQSYISLATPSGRVRKCSITRRFTPTRSSLLCSPVNCPDFKIYDDLSQVTLETVQTLGSNTKALSRSTPLLLATPPPPLPPRCPYPGVGGGMGRRIAFIEDELSNSIYEEVNVQGQNLLSQL